MNTIIRKNGHVVEKDTVVKTIVHIIKNKPGFYSIAEVQQAINSQVAPHERFTRDMVVSALIKVLRKSHV